jgi:hypothetical protein
VTVQDAARTATVPGQAGPSDPPLAAVAPVPPAVAPLLGRDRPLTADERLFLIGLTGLSLALGTIIVVGLLMAQFVWS